MTHRIFAEAVFSLIALVAPSLSGGGQGQAESLPLRAKHAGVNASKIASSAESAPQAVTVAQLEKAIETAKNKSDEEAAETIKNFELTERLSSLELARLSFELPGAKSKATLMAVGDASVFLELPKAEIPDNPAPDAVEQRRIVLRAEDYLKDVIPKLPDFYATRITTAFNAAWIPKSKDGTNNPGVLNSSGKFRARVLYRNGKEVVQAEGPRARGLSLTIQGTFGPVLATVIKDNLQTPMQWHGWEKGPNGAIAIFQFQVPLEHSHYSVSLPMAGLGPRRVEYRGEVGIEPDTGAILRLVLQSDPALAFGAFEHADIMLEYGTVVIGGREYICPVRGVSISRARYREIGIMRRDRAFILLNDVVFTDYHVFRSETRILPD